MSHMMNAWFNYLRQTKRYWCNGFTDLRLKKVREHVCNDKHIVSDILLRHRGADMYPQEMKITNKALFEHAISNLASATFDKMVEMGIYKIKRSRL